jgi:hypothetical protein
MTKKEIILLTLGVIIIIAGLVINEWVLGYFTSDGRIDSAVQVWIIRLFNITMISVGVLMIVLRNSTILPKLIASALIMVFMFVVFDVMLYMASPMLPPDLVYGMSPNAQVRYFRAHEDSLPWIYDQNIRYLKPNAIVELFDMSIKADTLGYRNPQHYLEQQEQIDVLLFGDSFIWGSDEMTIADHLRDMLDPSSVYSMGMAGSGIPQWRYHYERFISTKTSTLAPSVVVMNYYSGNDITDTQLFMGLEKKFGYVDSKDYFAYIKYQFLIASGDRKISLPKLPESVFLVNFIANSGKYRNSAQSSDHEVGQIPACLKHHEHDPGMLDAQVLDQIDKSVKTIREIYPDTHIILSYIPTSSGIYGDQMPGCPDLGMDIERQMESSIILASYAREADIHYLDATPVLREYNQDTPVWSENDHFSAAGYEIYAQQLADLIKVLYAAQVSSD